MNAFRDISFTRGPGGLMNRRGDNSIFIPYFGGGDHFILGPIYRGHQQIIIIER